MLYRVARILRPGIQKLNGIFKASKPFSGALVLAWVAGDMAAQQFPGLPSLPAMALAAAAVFLLWLARLKIPAAFLFGLAWALALAAWRLHDALPEALEQREALIEGQVLDVPESLDEGLRFRFRADALLDPPGLRVPRLVRLSWYRNVQAVKAGERWRLRVRLKRPHGYFNPGSMDYELWLFSQGIRATGYVVDDGDNLKLADASFLSVSALRQAVYDRLASILAGRPMGGIVTALVLGAESAISPGQWDVLRRTGTAHLVAFLVPILASSPVWSSSWCVGHVLGWGSWPARPKRWRHWRPSWQLGFIRPWRILASPRKGRSS